jgi:hypothetical protein
LAEHGVVGVVVEDLGEGGFGFGVGDGGEGEDELEADIRVGVCGESEDDWEEVGLARGGFGEADGLGADFSAWVVEGVFECGVGGDEMVRGEHAVECPEGLDAVDGILCGAGEGLQGLDSVGIVLFDEEALGGVAPPGARVGELLDEFLGGVDGEARLDAPGKPGG